MSELTTQLQIAVKRADEIVSRQGMVEAECNLDLLASRCKECGHVAKIDGRRLKICQHRLDWMRANIQKKEIDTSLSATIRRMENIKYGSCYTGKDECECSACDQNRLLDASRKWDAAEKQLDKFIKSFSDPKTTDPEWVDALIAAFDWYMATADTNGEWQEVVAARNRLKRGEK